MTMPTASPTLYLSLIQQYLSVFKIENATFLAERCVADHPLCSKAVYLLALCHHRSNKPRCARHIIERHCRLVTSRSSNNDEETVNTLSSMHYLSAQCSFELGEYSRAEDSLLECTRQSYELASQKLSYNMSFDDWVLSSSVRSCALSKYSHR